jgi:hypothetical protein
MERRGHGLITLPDALWDSPGPSIFYRDGNRPAAW